jgi:outer membrane protein TolC
MRSVHRGLFFSAIWIFVLQVAARPEGAQAQESVRLPPVSEMATSAPLQACRVTLAEARQRALSKNPALVLARLNINGKHHAAAAATKDYLPKILGNVTYFHFDNPLGTVLTTRGTVLPATIPVNVLNQNTALSTALVAQPITKLIAVNAAVQAARADECIAQAKLDQGAKQVLSGITQAYYALLGAQRIQTALQLQATMLEQAIAARPIAELRISLVQLRQGMLEVDAQIRELTDQLNDLLDFPPGTVLELIDPVPPLPAIESADQAVQMSMMNNPEVREAAQNINRAEAAIKLARMEYLPDVNVVGGFANQTGASYIQQNITFVGVTGSYTFWDWRKRNDVCQQRQADLAMAHQNLLVVSGKVQAEARKSFGAFQQALASYRLAQEMVEACKDAERGAHDPATIMSTKAATATAELELMKAEIAYRVAHAQLAAATLCE